MVFYSAYLTSEKEVYLTNKQTSKVKIVPFKCLYETGKATCSLVFLTCKSDSIIQPNHRHYVLLKHFMFPRLCSAKNRYIPP